MKNIILLTLIILLFSSCKLNKQTEPILKIGLIADPQYQDLPVIEERYYGESLWKLAEAIDTLNNNNVDFIQNLGDIINGEWRSYDSILPVYDKINIGIENYFLLGNHDFLVDSTKMGDILKTFKMPDFYYSYVKKNWRFIVLDATDYAYFSNYIHKYDIEKIDTLYAKTEGNENHRKWNGGIGEKQQSWLKEELKSADSSHQKVIIFSHMPIKPMRVATLWNSDEIVGIIENSPNVVAFVAGHHHDGGYAFSNGIHYITISGMVNTEISSFAILKIYEDSLVLKGYGNQVDLAFQFRTLNEKVVQF